MAHEIYRYGFVEISENDHGKCSSIKIFLSHAKAGDTGRLHAESIYQFIDSTNMSRFFDATETSLTKKLLSTLKNPHWLR